MTIQEIQVIRDSANKTALEYIQKRFDARKDASPSIGTVHAGVLTAIAVEIVDSMVQRPEQSDEAFDAERKASLFYAFSEVENGSALRQKKEVVAIIGKSTGKPAALASEFTE